MGIDISLFSGHSQKENRTTNYCLLERAHAAQDLGQRVAYLERAVDDAGRVSRWSGSATVRSADSVVAELNRTLAEQARLAEVTRREAEREEAEAARCAAVEARRAERERAAEERRAAADVRRAAAAERRREAEERAAPACAVQCCDGTCSPSCTYAHSGCCSHHGGVY